ncbi:MAG: glycerol-3-phosphate dehydrogenase [Candidatus Omnitrophica bacterium CG11_big_fil_rev_8_21_14_0_20_42_13]|uniref:Glycerol-3-phosphate dehydrogenase [NAD(P)+] n=1 Tax=Candidatus Ghiorseimicrobium undicola TaxID=1974746 RepID=A0A2H0M1Z0_9BACT|nr:MAG: glycerol-3-phosphate dehydrogenase [Candidatus Omnitrophica bacterium CG11_big_fil_rev_8_21_14_0_20_42_13]
MKIDKITVLGDGGWGTTLSMLLAEKGFGLTLWTVSSEYAGYLNRTRRNVKFLPDFTIPRRIKITSDLTEALCGAKVVVLAIPSQYLRGVLDRIEPEDLRDKFIVSAVKGIENNTLMRMSEVIRDVWGNFRVSVLSGPTIAVEVARKIPTAAVIASGDAKTAEILQNVFFTDRFRVYKNNDLIGVELGGSIKNIIAIACGICDGLKFGTNTTAALLARGLAEMSRLGVAMGARAHTFYGISGLGDLATTCASKYSRNRGVGEKVGRGKKLKDIISRMNMVAEGVPTVKSAYELSKKYKVDMPITKEVYAVLYKNKSPLRAVDDLMKRRMKEE